MCGNTRVLRITGCRHASAARHERSNAGEHQRRTQSEMFTEPSAQQCAWARRQQDQPTHRAGHTAEQRRGCDRLAQREERDEDQHRADAEHHQHRREHPDSERRGWCDRAEQPTDAAHRDAEHQRRARTEAARDAIADRAGGNGATPSPTSSIPRRLRTSRACVSQTRSARPMRRDGTSARRRR